MRQVVIGFDKKGMPYVISAPRKVEVVFKQNKTLRWIIKRAYKRILYQLKNFIGV